MKVETQLILGRHYRSQDAGNSFYFMSYLRTKYGREYERQKAQLCKISQ